MVDDSGSEPTRPRHVVESFPWILERVEGDWHATITGPGGTTATVRVTEYAPFDPEADPSSRGRPGPTRDDLTRTLRDYMIMATGHDLD